MAWVVLNQVRNARVNAHPPDVQTRPAHPCRERRINIHPALLVEPLLFQPYEVEFFFRCHLDRRLCAHTIILSWLDQGSAKAIADNQDLSPTLEHAPFGFFFKTLFLERSIQAAFFNWSLGFNDLYVFQLDFARSLFTIWFTIWEGHVHTCNSSLSPYWACFLWSVSL